MSDMKQNRNSQSEETDWGRKLREFMERQSETEDESKTTAPADTSKQSENPSSETAASDDDARQIEMDTLLLDQLNKSRDTYAASTPSDLPTQNASDTDESAADTTLPDDSTVADTHAESADAVSGILEDSHADNISADDGTLSQNAVSENKTSAQSEDPMQISLSETFQLMDEGIYPAGEDNKLPNASCTWDTDEDDENDESDAFGENSTVTNPSGKDGVSDDSAADEGTANDGTSDEFADNDTDEDDEYDDDEIGADTANGAHIVRDDSDFESEDTDLYVSLGYEDELRRTPQGIARADRLQKRTVAAQPVGTRNSIPFVYNGKEYTGRTMTKNVDKDYRRARLMCILRLLAAAVGSGILLCVDVLPLFISETSNTGLASFLYSPFYPLAELVLTSAFFVPCWRRLLLGARALWNFEPVRFSIPTVSFAFVSLYETVVIFVDRTVCSVPLFGGVSLLLLTVSCTADLLALLAQWRSFRVVSSGKAQYIMTTVQSKGDGDASANEEADKKAFKPLNLRICRTDRLLDFFARAEKYNSKTAVLNYLIPIALLLALIVAGVSLVLQYAPAVNTVASAGARLVYFGLPLFIGTFLACMPGAFLFSLTLPLFCANRQLSRHGCAVIGEAAPESYIPPKSKAGTVIWVPDGQAFKAGQVREITDTRDTYAEKYRMMAYKLFALTDCSLRTIGISVKREELSHISISLHSAEEGLLTLHMTDTQTNETVEVMAGTYDALTGQGIRIAPDCLPERLKVTGETELLYLAFDRRLHLVCTMAYKPDAWLREAVDALKANGCRMALLTYDPAMNRNVLRSAGLTDVQPVRAKRFSELYIPRSAALIATQKGLDLVRAWLAVKQMHTSYRRSILFGWAVCIGSGLTAMLTGLFSADMLYLSWAVALWQFLTVAGAVALSVITMYKHRNNTEDKQ